jgi:hypothetical protein
MSQAKAALHKHRKKGLPVLGAAGLSLCLGSGAPAALGVATTDIPACSVTVTEGHTLREEEFTDITLATFHIFDREEAPRPHPRIAGACGACGSGFYEAGSGTGAGAGGGGGGFGSGFHGTRIGACAGGGCGGCGSGLHERPAKNRPVRSMSPPERKPTEPTVQTLKRPQERPHISKHQDQNAGRSRREADTRATDEKASGSQRAASTRATDENATRQAQPELDGLVTNQSAGHQVEPQMATPVSNSAN